MNVTRESVNTELQVRSLFARGFTVWRCNFIFFSLAFLIALIPDFLFDKYGYNLPQLLPAGFHTKEANSLLTWLLILLADGVTTPTALATLRGQHISIQKSVSIGLARFFPMAITMACIYVIVSIGTILLVIPGIIAALALLVSTKVCIAEQLNPIASLQRSRTLTKNSRGEIFWIFVTLFCSVACAVWATAIVGFITVFVAGHFGTLSSYDFETGPIGSLALQTATSGFLGTLLTVLYYNLRVLRDGDGDDQRVNNLAEKTA